MSTVVRLYRMATRLLPPEIRREHGDEMALVFSQQLTRAWGRSVLAAARLVGREALDLTRVVAREWRLELFGRDGVRMARHIDGGAGNRGTRRVKGDWMGTLTQDIRHGIRALPRRPGFTLVAVGTIAVGIGANTAIFTVVDDVLLRSLPFEGGDRLALVWGRSTVPDGYQRSWTSFPDLQDFLATQQSFEALGAYRAPPATITTAGAEPTSVQIGRVTAGLLQAFGVPAALGRIFQEAEDVVEGDAVAVLGHGFWRQRYGGDPTVLGGSLVVDGVTHTIVGVMPESFDFPRGVSLWLPAAQDVGRDERDMHRLIVVGRLKPGTDATMASEEFASLAARLEEAYPDSNLERSAWVEPLKEALVGNVRPALLIMLGAVGLVLLIVCANVANLLLARTAARSREVAVRTALGAGRARIVRQLLTESGLLAVCGGVAGAVLAYGGLEVILASAPPDALPRAAEIGMDSRVFAVMAVVTLTTALVFGLVPALKGSHTHVADTLKGGTRGMTTLSGGRLRGSLVVLETALAMVLVVGSGLLIRSFVAVQSVDPGFDPDDLWEITLSLPFTQYTSDRWPEVATFFDQVTRRTRELPGVTDAAVAYASPTNPSWTTSFWVEGRPEPAGNVRPEAQYRPVSPEYFKTAGIQLLRGRDFTNLDDANAPGVVIINQAFAGRHFPGEDPIGQVLLLGSWWDGTPTGRWEIVAMAPNVRYFGRESQTLPGYYFPHAQRPMTDMTLLARLDGDIADVLPLIRNEVWSFDATVPVENVSPTERALAASVAGRRFNTILLGIFGVVALMLAGGGLFGVLSYTVSQRTHEMGVRVSLGAQPSDVRRLVVAQGLRLALGGLALGLLGAVGFARLTSSLLFGVTEGDPVTLASVSGLLVVVALLASYFPARRATRVDPVNALRAD